MKKIILALLTLVLLFAASCASEPSGDPVNSNIIVEKDGDGRPIKNTYLDENGNVQHTETLSYDQSDRVAQKCRYDQDGTLLEKADFTYHDNGNVHLTTEQSYTNGAVTLVTETESSRDGKSSHTRQYKGDTRELTLETFVEDGGRYIKDIFYQDGDLHHTTETVTNDDGTTDEKTFDANGAITGHSICNSQTLERIKYTFYSPAGVIREVSECNVDGFANKVSYYEDGTVCYIEWTNREWSNDMGNQPERVALIADGVQRIFDIAQPEQSVAAYFPDGVSPRTAEITLYNAEGVAIEDKRILWADGTTVQLKRYDNEGEPLLVESYNNEGKLFCREHYTNGQRVAATVFAPDGREVITVGERNGTDWVYEGFIGGSGKLTYNTSEYTEEVIAEDYRLISCIRYEPGTANVKQFVLYQDFQAVLTEKAIPLAAGRILRVAVSGGGFLHALVLDYPNKEAYHLYDPSGKLLFSCTIDPLLSNRLELTVQNGKLSVEEYYGYSDPPHHTTTVSLKSIGAEKAGWNDRQVQNTILWK